LGALYVVAQNTAAQSRRERLDTGNQSRLLTAQVMTPHVQHRLEKARVRVRGIICIPHFGVLASSIHCAFWKVPNYFC